MRLALQVLGAVPLLFVLAAGAPAAAEPVDLEDRSPRRVRVALEKSPPHQPSRLDREYSEPVLAWFEPGPGEYEVSIRVAGPHVERLLEGFDPVPGSFGEFVWILEVETGHVISAVLAGSIRQSLDWGLFETRVRAKISARMTTLQQAGFRPARSLLGRTLFDHCLAGEGECSLVAPRPYDRYTGYVNAVGSISARAAGLATETYSPLGEALFSEVPQDTSVSAH